MTVAFHTSCLAAPPIAKSGEVVILRSSTTDEKLKSLGLKSRRVMGSKAQVVDLSDSPGKSEHTTDLAPLFALCKKLIAQKAATHCGPNYQYSSFELTPNDEHYGSLWGMVKVQAPQAWGLTSGSSSVVVAVVDTGTQLNHPDLAANIWVNSREIPGDGIDNDGNGFIDDIHGYDWVNGDSNPTDDHGHGTHVAGTIGAVGNNGTGVTGVNFAVQIQSLKTLGSNGYGYTSSMAAAVEYAANNGAHVINMSLGGAGYDGVFEQAIRNAGEKGVVVVVAAGNSASNNDSSPSYPAAFTAPNLITVAATDQNDSLASFSNYGLGTTHIAAPGVNILSTYIGDGYQSLAGTSMATPLVAGAVALAKAANRGLSVNQLRPLLLDNADVLPQLDGVVQGGRRLNIYRLVTAALNSPTVPLDNVYFDNVGSSILMPGIDSSPDDPPEDIVTTPIVTTPIQNGRSSNRIDFVFLADGYKQADISQFVDSAAGMSTAIFSEKPFFDYKRYFNVHLVHSISNSTGISNELFLPEPRDTALKMRFWCHDSESSLCIDVARAYQYAGFAPDVDQIIGVANSSKDTGAAYAFSDIALVTGSGPNRDQNLLHQLGHSFGSLADETSSGSWPDYTGFEPAERNVSMLPSTALLTQKVKWWRWLGHDGGPEFAGVVNSIEGAMGSERRIYRPTLTSKMRELNQPFNHPSVESLIIETYKHVSPIDDATPESVSSDGTYTFFVTPMRPMTHDLSIQWFMDGTPIQGATGEQFRPNNYPLANGLRTLSVKVVDPTPLVRDEAARDRYMTASRSWTVNINQQPPRITQQPESITRFRGQVARFAVVAQGESLRYQWFKNGSPLQGETSNILGFTVAAMSENGDRFHCVVSSVTGAVTSSVATLTVLNRAPIISEVGGRPLRRNEDVIFPISASDPDGDPLMYTPHLLTSGTGISLSIVEGSGLRVVTNSSFLGEADVELRASDGMVESVLRFKIRVVNGVPVLSLIPSLQLHRRPGSVSISLAASDADSELDSLVYSASSSNPNVSLAVVGNVLNVTHNGNFEGVVGIQATVSDGLATDSESFTITYYNNAPVIGDIPSIEQPWSPSSQSISVSFSDPDGDPLTNSVSAAVYDLSSFAAQYKFRHPKRGWQFNSMGLQEKHLESVLTANGPAVDYFILPDGRLFLYRGTFGQSIFVTQFPATYYYDPRLLISQPASVPPQAQLVGNEVIITPQVGSTGTFLVSVTSRDPWASSSKSFAVSFYEPQGHVTPIPFQPKHWRDPSLTVNVDYYNGRDSAPTADVNLDISQFDADEIERVTRECQPAAVHFRMLDGFSPPMIIKNGASLVYNNLGMQEKYIACSYYHRSSAGVAGPRHMFILPNGDVYTFDFSSAPPQLFANLPAYVYRDLNYLHQAEMPSAPTYIFDDLPLEDRTRTYASHDPVAITQEQNTVHFTPAERWTGKSGYQIKACSSPTNCDTTVLGLEVYNTIPSTKISKFIYVNGRRALPFELKDEDALDQPHLQASVDSSMDHIGYQAKIVRDFNLRPLPEGTKYNHRGWRERYMIGTVNGVEQELAVLPSGELVQLEGDGFATTPLAWFDDGFYRFTRSYLSFLPSYTPPARTPLNVWIENGMFFYESNGNPAANFRLDIWDDYSKKLSPIWISLGNSPPYLQPLTNQRMHWREATREVPVTARDDDGDPLTLSATIESSELAYNLDQAHDFFPAPGGDRMNAGGAMERYFKGTKNIPGQEFWYFILPTGEVREFNSSVANSISLGFLPRDYYYDPELLIHAVPPSLAPIAFEVEGLKLRIRQLETGWVGKVLVKAQVADPFGATDSSYFSVEVYDNAPVVSPISSVDTSYNNNVVSIALSASDIDEEAVSFSARAGTVQHLAFEMDSLYDFSISATGPKPNHFGFREKSLEGTLSGQRQQFAILPSGVLYQWNGKISNSTALAYLGEDYYRTPSLLTNVATPPPLPPITTSVQGAQLNVSFANSYRGTVTAWVRGSDGNLSDSKVVTISRSNRPLTFDQIPPQTVHWRTDKLELAPPVTDPDNDRIIYTASLVDTTAAYNLDRTHDFFIPPTGIIFNKEGLSEKLFQGTQNNPTARPAWYAILPSGDIYLYNTRISNSTKLGKLPAPYYEDISRLVDVAPPTFRPASVSVEGSTVVIDPTYKWLGSFVVSITATDGEFTATREFSVTVVNTNPVFAQPDTTKITRSAAGVRVPYSSYDVDPQDASYIASAAGHHPVVHFANAVVQELGGSPIVLSSAFNTLGWREKHLRGVVNGVTRQYIILPNGEVREANNDVLSGRLVSVLPPRYYNNPNLLTKTEAVPPSPNISYTIDSAALVIKPLNGWTGIANMVLTAYDGNYYDWKEVPISIGNAAPELSVIPNQTMHWRSDKVAVDLSAVDFDGDSVTFSVKAMQNVPVALSLTGSRLTIDPLGTFTGSFDIVVTASDGFSSSQRTFNVTVTNNAPVFSTVGQQRIIYGTSSHPVPFSVTDPDGDPLTVGCGTSSAVRCTIQDSSAVLSIPFGYAGTFTVFLTANDQVAGAERHFVVEVVNSAPVISKLPLQRIPWRQSAASLTIPASDSDGNSLSFSASVTAATIPASASVQGSTMTLSVPSQRLGTVQVSVSATDGNLTGYQIFNFEVYNTAPKFRRVETQYIPLGEQLLTVDITADDAEGDPLTYSAQAIPFERIAFELDQRHNFELRYGDFFYNVLGNEEKYIQGTKNDPAALYWYVIYPNGDFYEWRGQLSNSSYLGRMPQAFYEDPTRLFDVADPGAMPDPATLSLADNILSIIPAPGYLGQFLIRANVTDTKAQDVTEFVVEVFDPDEVDDGEDPDNNGCNQTVTKHRGEFTKAAHQASFVAEGRIGDAGTDGSNTTFEMALSRTTAGPFANGETADLIWEPGAVVPFSLVYDSVQQRATFTLGNQTVSHGVVLTQPLTDLLIRTRANQGASTVISDLKLNGNPVGHDAISSDQHGTVNVLQIAIGTLNNGFTLEGNASLSFFRNSGVISKNSEVAFQIFATNIAGHTSDCAPGADKKVTICHQAGANGRNSQTIRVSRSALDSHLAHGDIIGACPGEGYEEIDPQLCASGIALQSPVYAQWNTVLNMSNTLELTNRGNSSLAVKVTTFSILGEKVGSTTLTVPANTVTETAMTELPGHVSNSQGLLRLEFSGALDGRMIYRRVNGSNTEFVFAVPLMDGLFGETSVAFNTIQPSSIASERGNVVMNWLSITNLDPETKRFRVRTYARSGQLLGNRTIDIAPYTRANLDGGHDLAGPANAGIHIVTPENLNTEYLAELTRFGGNEREGLTPSAYRFAFPLVAQLPQSDPNYLPITRNEGENSWIEISNLLGKKARAAVNLFDNKGKLIESVDARIQPRGTLVLNVAKYLKVGMNGYAQVVPFETRSVVAQSVTYYLSGKSSGSVSSAYSAEGQRATSCLATGAYNIKGFENYLLLANTSNKVVTAVINMVHPSRIGERVRRMKAKTAVLLPIHNPQQLLAPANSAGIIYVRSREGGQTLYSQIVRLKRGSRGEVDASMRTAVR